MASTSGSEFVVNSAAETSQNVDLVFVDEDEMPLTSVAIGTAYLERESDEERGTRNESLTRGGLDALVVLLYK